MLADLVGKVPRARALDAREASPVLAELTFVGAGSFLLTHVAPKAIAGVAPAEAVALLGQWELFMDTACAFDSCREGASRRGGANRP